MAVRTISSAGGNWNAVGTWNEGTVPVLGDTVLATVTSGQLTVNVAAACTSIDFTNYTNTLTMNAALTVSGNVTLVTAMTISGVNGLVLSLSHDPSTITSNGKIWPNALSITSNTSTIPIITLADSWIIGGTLTLTAASTSGITCNGNSLSIGGGLQYTGVNKILNGTTSFILNGTGTWTFGLNTRIHNNLTINTAGTITIGTLVRLAGSGQVFTYTSGKVITTNSTFIIASSLTLVNMDKVTWNIVTVVAGVTVTMNKFFSGNPKQKITIQSGTSGTVYTITFQDTFEKIAKFVKVSDCSLTRRGQLLMLTPNSDKGGNFGIRYINQSPNGIAKNSPTIKDTMTSPALGLAADPCFTLF